MQGARGLLRELLSIMKHLTHHDSPGRDLI